MLADSRDIAAYFDEAVAAGADPKVAANWIMGDIMAHLKQEKMAITSIRLSAASLAELLALIAEGAISGKVGPCFSSRFLRLLLTSVHALQIAKDILPTLLQEGGSPRALVKAKGLVQISDTTELEALVQKIVDENPKQVCVNASSVAPGLQTDLSCLQVEEFRGGRDKLKGFFVGQIMKSSGGRANPAVVEQLLMARLRSPT